MKKTRCKIGGKIGGKFLFKELIRCVNFEIDKG